MFDPDGEDYLARVLRQMIEGEDTVLAGNTGYVFTPTVGEVHLAEACLQLAREVVRLREQVYTHSHPQGNSLQDQERYRD